MTDELQKIINGDIEEINSFKLYQIKLTHYYWLGDDKDYRYPISTSIEYSSKYDYLNNKLIWNSKISHNFKNIYEHELNNDVNEEIIEEDVEFKDKLNKLESLDFINCKNNYFTDKEPEKYSYWEINYNKHFYIVGTYDKKIELLKELYQIFDMKKLINNEIKKVKENIEFEIKGE